jgi:hypothetical protein
MVWLIPSAESVVPAIFLIAAMSVAGTANVFWLWHPRSKEFDIPIDGGRTFRGRRILGDNKKFRGFIVMVPFSGIAFCALSLLRPALPEWAQDSLWPLSGGQYALLGIWGGFAFMLGELPNSFVKRQLGIPPGEAPSTYWSRLVFYVVDRTDSILALLIALSLVVPVSPATWVYVLVAGSVVHLGFSAMLYALNIKNRLA